MELIVAVCRTLANRPRLRLLHAVYTQPDATVKALAKAARQPLYTTSHHLKLLRNYRFIQTKPSGRRVYCQAAQQHAVTQPFLRALHQLVHDLFVHDNLRRTLVQVCGKGAKGSWEDVFDALVQAFTTYTHLRRLLILREVIIHGSLSTVELRNSIGMSQDAMGRHVTKLCRRRLLLSEPGKPGHCRLALPSNPPLQRTLWKLVRQELKRF